MSPNSIILLDIEGTITSKSFVTDCLFPYVRKNLTEYVTSNWEKEELQKDIEALRDQAETDKKNCVEGCISIPSTSACISNTNEVKKAVIKNVLWQMDLDRKTTALKSLQGHMWKYGYESKQVEGHVYLDAIAAIKKWTEQKKKIMIYSSGSIAAQKLLFKYSEHGDLTSYFCEHFDTTIGSKKEKSSYEKIASACHANVANFTFYTDSIEEAQAASEAGMNVILVQRPEDEPNPQNPLPNLKVIKTFDDALFS